MDRAQVAAGGQQMRRERVAQRVRRRAFGQAQRAPQILHQPLHDARVQPLAARAEELGIEAVDVSPRC